MPGIQSPKAVLGRLLDGLKKEKRSMAVNKLKVDIFDLVTSVGRAVDITF